MNKPSKSHANETKAIANTKRTTYLMHERTDFFTPLIVIDAKPMIQVGPGDSIARKGARRSADDGMFERKRCDEHAF